MGKDPGFESCFLAQCFFMQGLYALNPGDLSSGQASADSVRDLFSIQLQLYWIKAHNCIIAYFKTKKGDSMIGRTTSPPSRLQPIEPATTIYRSRSPDPPAYSEQRSQLRQESVYHPQPSGTLSGTPSISFGFTGSNFKNNAISIPTPDGNDFYEGELNAMGHFHGLGRYIYVKNRHQYQGQFQNGKPHGKGILYKNIGNTGNYGTPKSTSLFAVYDGEWRNGLKNGNGKYFYNSDAHFYEGAWLNDQRHGTGTYVNPSIKYTGKWEQGRMEGPGQLFNLRTNTRYHGNFKDNEFINGTITYPNKHEYSGQSKNGLRDGPHGRYHYCEPGHQAHQTKYIGGWKNNMKSDKSGNATLTFPNGEILKGGYEDNKLVGDVLCQYQWPDGDIFNGWLKWNGTGYNCKGIITKPNGKQQEVT